MSLRTKSPFTVFLRENGRSLRWISRYTGIPEKVLRRYASGELQQLPAADLERIAQGVGCRVADIPAPGWTAGRPEQPAERGMA